MEFYHHIITSKSFKILQNLKKERSFILIGGWAVFFYAHTLKSKDIDIILDYEELAKLKEEYEVIKNERLKKYEIKFEEVDIDIYLPYYSDLGIKAEEIKNKIVSREGFNLPELEILFLLKLYAWQSRQGSVKGRKDELDILGLASLEEFDWQKYLLLVKKYDFEKYHRDFIDFLKNTRRVKEFNINEQKMAKIKKSILSKIKK